MPDRHPVAKPLPRFWLMTDERIGDSLRDAVNRLPRGGGIVFRHYATPLAKRRELFARLAAIADERDLILVRAGAEPLAEHESGVHGAGPMRAGGLRTWPAHDRTEALAGIRAGADLLFVSPVFATRSHPGAAPLGIDGATAIVRDLHVPAITLGGMTEARFAAMAESGFHGWAAIDAWL